MSAQPRYAHAIYWGDTYADAYKSVPGTMAFCGFRSYRDFFRYLLSTAFLPYFVDFIEPVQYLDGQHWVKFAAIDT